MTMTSPETSPATRSTRFASAAGLDAGLLVARIGLGVVMFLHGWQKFFTNGIAGTEAFFEMSGVPLAGASAVGAATLELVGGVLLIVGAAVRVVGVLLAIDMIGAIIFVHGGNGFWATDGGYEFVLLLGVVAIALALTGAGRWSVDAAVTGRRGR